ncbi:hypothetical protein Fmac_032658 [Flemingia macrophylla]|uniref:Uncharacterized protein n=1 Tax=Flemingia macrophylla TaxID=520843 RepID=A0ABD1L5J3_9FABA
MMNRLMNVFQLVRCEATAAKTHKDLRWVEFVDIYNHSTKTVVSVDLRCSRCRQKVMKLANCNCVEEITFIILDPDQNTVVVVAEAVRVRMIKNVRKLRNSVTIQQWDEIDGLRVNHQTIKERVDLAC